LKRTVLITAVRKALEALRVPRAGDTLVVGVSGGADSVALLDACATLSSLLEFRVLGAHFDHRLRPGSEEDGAFCGSLCERLGVRCVQGASDVRRTIGRGASGVEEAAREARYAFLRRTMAEEGAAAIAVAHTRDDQAETLLLRLLRGAGTRGLASMRPRYGDVLRPLLRVCRADVLEHLKARGLEHREDPTNADLGLARNRVRRELIPYLEMHFNPSILEALARTAELLADDEAALKARLPLLAPDAVVREDEAVIVRGSGLRGAPPAAGRLTIRGALELSGGLRGVNAGHVEALLGLATAGASGRRVSLPGARDATVSFGDLRIAPRRGPSHAFALPLPVPGRAVLPGGWEVVARPLPSAQPACGEAAFSGPRDGLVVRTRRSGDRVRLRHREMSLKRFLMERRVPFDERSRLPLIASGDRVLWVAGQAIETPPAPGESWTGLTLVPTAGARAQAAATNGELAR
jgi:tRNA(Ile)-lysidine synthase